MSSEILKSYCETYPQLESLSGSVSKTSGVPYDWVWLTSIDMSSWVNESQMCPNYSLVGGCQGGGLPIGSILHEAISKRQEKVELTYCCQGRERLNRSNTRRCTAHWKISCTIAYKPDHLSPTPNP